MRILRFFAACAVLLSVGVAHADGTGLNGFNVQTLHFTPDQSGVISVYGSQTLGHLKPAVEFSLSGMGGTVEAGNPVNNQRSKVIGNMLEGDLSGALGVGDRFDFGVVVPVAITQQAMNVNTQRHFVTAALGDILLDAKLRILTDTGHSVGLALLGRLSVPTGNTEQFFGWSDPTGEFRLLVDKTLDWFYLVANVGYRIVNRLQVSNRVNNTRWNIVDDDRLTYGLGFSAALPFQKKTWSVYAEAVGESVVSDASKMTTPFVVDVGIGKKWENGMMVRVAGGRGITDALGSPPWRALLSVGMDWGRRARNTAAKERVHEYIRRVLAVILFEFDSAELNAADERKVEKAAHVVNEIREEELIITGYTDSVGSERYNRELGLRRAQAVADELVSFGVDTKRLKVHSFGEERPFDSNKTPRGRAQNRRVEVEM